jgi:DNA invertase Pin-like site-specific DNA recombinase
MKRRTTPTAPRRKAFSYARFSTDEQAKGDSLRRQTTMAADYAARHNLDLDSELTFEDLGVSGFRGKNAATGRLGDFIEAVQRGVVKQGSVLLVENLDRVSRQAPLDTVMLLNKIVSAGVSVVTLTDNREYTEETLRRDPMTLIVAVMTAIRANEESERKAERSREAWIGKKLKAKKEIITAMAPCWLKPNADRTGWLQDRAKVKIVNRIFNLTLKGWGVNRIAQTFNEEGVPAIGRERRRRDNAVGPDISGRWYVTFIQKLLANPAVIGEFHDHKREYDHNAGKYRRTATGESIKNYYPSIIDQAVFKKVAAQLASRKGKARSRSGRISNMFAGLSRCPRCGASMTSVNKGNGSKVYLACSKAKLRAGCPYHAVRLSDVEDAFISAAWVGDFIRNVPTGNQKLDEYLNEATYAVESIDLALDQCRDAWRDQPSNFLAAEIRRMEKELQDATTRLRELSAQAESADHKLLDKRAQELTDVLPSPFGPITKDGKEAPPPADKDAINAVLHRLFDHVVIDYDRGNLVIVWRNGAKTRIKYGKPMPRKKAA